MLETTFSFLMQTGLSQASINLPVIYIIRTPVDAPAMARREEKRRERKAALTAMRKEGY